MSDNSLTRKIHHLEHSVRAWAREKDLWHDAGFYSYQERHDAQPRREPVISVLACEGPLNPILFSSVNDELYEQFSDLLSRLGYWFELYDTVSLHIYAACEDEQRAFSRFFEWQWICSLVEQDFHDIYSEIYSYFAMDPTALRRLHWRQFERLLGSIFRNQGYEVELGPGRGDGGVDLRLLQRDPIGDLLTFVQAKSNAPRRKIALQPVQALHGASVAGGATSSLFITTSDYLPSARRFAARQNVQMDLYTSRDVVDWCRQASNGIIRDKSVLVSPAGIRRIASQAVKSPTESIVHHQSFLRGTYNQFALVLKETKHAALLMHLPRRVVEDDGYGQRGKEVPDTRSLLQNRTLTPKSGDVWRAKKKQAPDGTIYFWDGERVFRRWLGEAICFDYMD